MCKYAAALLIVSLLLVGRPSPAATVKLTHKEYAPTFSESLTQAYKGTHIYFSPFSNEAEDTSLWSYASETTNDKYKIQDNRLNYYLLYAFQVAGRALGMIVYENETANPALRRMDLVFTSWSHERFRCLVSVSHGGVLRAQKAFNIEFPPAASMEPEHLKHRAYDGITKVFTAILEDADVRQALLGKPTETGLGAGGGRLPHTSPASTARAQ
jgi:hypothetical protein